MITEDYCSYEVSKLLKEKGFLKGVDLRLTNNLSYYDNIGLSHNLNRYYDSLVGDKIDFVVAPTHQMAMKWLREMHNVDIDIDAAVGMSGVKYYIPYISTYKPLEGDSSKVRPIKKFIYYRNDKGVTPALQHFDSYEETVEAALKYVLENLI